MNSSAIRSPMTSSRRLEKPSTSDSSRSRRSASPGRGWIDRAISIVLRSTFYVRKNPRSGGRQVVDDDISREFFARTGFLRSAVSAAHENALRADRARQPDVDPLVADDERP